MTAKVLAIETSCDDTSLSIVQFDKKFVYPEKLINYSQIEQHQQYWGVVPELASRLHNEQMLSILEKIWISNIPKVDSIITTGYPGLPWSLIIGKTVAATLGHFYEKDFFEENHIHWHIFSIYLERNIDDIPLPAVFISVSWGHNDIYFFDYSNWFEITHLGKTIDDAAGECFDKAAKMLGWPYPGGPWISQMAAEWKPNWQIDLSPTFLKKDEFNFSFSGLKSKIYYLLKDFEKKWIKLDAQQLKDICYTFQESVITVLTNKLIKAAEKYQAKSVCIVWWVSANDRFYEFVQEQIWKKWLNLNVFRPIKKVYSTDNAAMIGAAYLLKNKLK